MCDFFSTRFIFYLSTLHQYEILYASAVPSEVLGKYKLLRSNQIDYINSIAINGPAKVCVSRDGTSKNIIKTRREFPTLIELRSVGGRLTRPVRFCSFVEDASRRNRGTFIDYGNVKFRGSFM